MPLAYSKRRHFRSIGFDRLDESLSTRVLVWINRFHVHELKNVDELGAMVSCRGHGEIEEDSASPEAGPVLEHGIASPIFF